MDFLDTIEEKERFETFLNVCEGLYCAYREEDSQ